MTRGSAFRDCSAREIDLVGARTYVLDPRENDVRGLRVGLPEGAALLRVFGIVIES